MVYSGAEYAKIAEMQHYSVRTRDFRYVRYNNGYEELYDHRKDPYEWHNLADKAEYETIRKGLRKKLDAMTGLSIGVIPPRPPSRLEKGEVLTFTFEDFDLKEEIFTWPAQNRATIARARPKVIDGRASLQIHGPGSPWNTVSFKTIEVPPGLTCNVRFDCRAVKTHGKSYPYYLLSRGKFKSGFTRVPLQEGTQKTVTGTLTNDQSITLNLVIGFTVGGTYVIDNVEVRRQ